MLSTKKNLFNVSYPPVTYRAICQLFPITNTLGHFVLVTADLINLFTITKYCSCLQ